MQKSAMLMAQSAASLFSGKAFLAAHFALALRSRLWSYVWRMLTIGCLCFAEAELIKCKLA